MSKLLWLAWPLVFVPKVHAACSTPITVGMTSTQQQTAINSCSSGSTAAYPAGNYSNLTTISVPCGVSIAGPAVPLARYTGGDGYARYGYAPTAIISSTANPAFSYGTCSTAQSFEYIEVNGNRPSNGGQAIYATNSGGVSNLTISYNYFHGNNWSGGGECYGCELILFDGNGTPAHLNDTVSWNRFGANGDCSGVMTNFTYGGYTGDGGYCTAIGWHNNMTNLTVSNNFIYYQEEGIKGHEGSIDYNCVNCFIQYNDISNFHRIAIETQEQGVGGGAAVGTTITFQYNSIHDPYTPGNGTFGISSNNGYTNDKPSINTAISNDLSNVIIDNVAYASGSPSAWVGLGIEFWSMHTGSVGNNNLIQGEWVNSFMVGLDGAMSASNNHIQSSYGWGGSNTPADCSPSTPGSFGWWNQERSPVNTPAGSGNQCDFFDGSAQSSATPTISPASGSVSGSQVVTFTDPGFTSGVGPQGNTGIWYTTDGSTPFPGTGTATYVASGGIYTLPSSGTVTVKAVGMWGAANQPATYPTGPHNAGGTGYGYVPSAQVSATYTISGTPTAAVPVFSPATESFSGTLSVAAASSTSGATLYCTNNGTTPSKASPVYSAPFSLTATTTLQCIAAATGYLTSAAGSGTYTAAAAPTITGGYQGNTGNINTLAVGATAIQQVAYAVYSDGNTRTLPDAYGNTATWSSANPAILHVSSTGLISCLAPSTGMVNSEVSASPGAIAMSAWGWSCTGTAPTLQTVTLATTGGVSSIHYQTTNQILATCHYSDGSTTSCNTADSHGNAVSMWTSSAPATVTISSSGLATGAALGSGNLTAMVAGITSTPALTLSVTSAATLVSGYLSPASGSCNPGNTVQFAAYCHYTTGSDQSCTVTDIYGDRVTGWASGTPADVTISDVGSAHPGLAACVAVGSSSITATLDSTLTSSAAPVTVTTPGITLTGVSLATAGGVTGLAVGSTNLLQATCTYSDGSTTSCTSPDAHGNVASGWASSSPSFATVSSGGLVTGVAAGLASITASAGGHSSAALPLTVSLIPSGTYTITITGPVTMTGTVHF